MNHAKSILSATLLVAIAAAASAYGQQPAPEFRWGEQDEGQITLFFGDRPVMRYECAAYDDSSGAAREETYKPFHHVFAPDGSRPLTKGPGGLYSHHRGLFYGFNEVTYGDGQRCDIWHCTDGAYQSHEEVLWQSADADQAAHCVAVDWHGRGGELFAREMRRYVVRQMDGGTQIDFSSLLRTSDGQPIHLDGDPQHAGFHFRAAQEVAASTARDTYYLRTDGKGDLRETRNWDARRGDEPLNAECENRPWNAMSFVVGGDRYTALYIDHPDNPKPARYSERDYGRFGSYFVADVTEDDPLEVHYRVWIQPGEMTVEQCQAKADEFQVPQPAVSETAP